MCIYMQQLEDHLKEIQPRLIESECLLLSVAAVQSAMERQAATDAERPLGGSVILEADRAFCAEGNMRG